ncbi:hypothetical protein R3W88_003868 [Solanum pinnatisectum]|uniref:Uncharacterized protein n=1 Tax=Solanum pinnatisectum TaxID=50273 RepID=A0AAV9MQC2_9SOLN|nr:hypothetical protein R3W88_003868 [Solanum pinnatisectum]
MKPKGEYKDIPVQIKTEGAEISLTQAKQENCDFKEISNSNLDDNKEYPLPLVLIMTYTNIQGAVSLQNIETSAEVIVNKVQKLFGIYSHKARQQLGLVIIGVVDSKINACLVAANVNSEMQPATLAAMSPEWKVLKLRMAMQRFGGERASNVVNQYFKEDNFSLDGSDHVKQYFLYHISSASGASSDPISTLDAILVINVQKLCKNNGVNSGIIKAANQITILFIMAFTCSNQGIYNIPSCQMKFLDMNLEDKVLFGGGSIVVILDDFIRAYGLDAANMTDPVDIIGPSKMLETFIWDPGLISYC